MVPSARGAASAYASAAERQADSAAKPARGSFLADGGERFTAADCGAVLPADVGERDVVVAAACI